MNPAAARRLALAAAAAGFLLPAAGSVWHILERGSPPLPDEAHYVAGSLRLWQALRSGELSAFAHVYTTALGAKAPLITLIAFPFYALFGQGLAQALLANLAVLGAASFFAYRIGCRLLSPGAGAMAVWGLNLTPIVYGLSRAFFVETCLAALAAAFVYYLLRGGSRLKLGALLGLGLLCKVTFPLYVAVPACLLAGRGRTWRDWAAAGAVAAGIAATWYSSNLPHLLSFAWSAAFGPISLRRASGLGLLDPAQYGAVVLGQCWGWYATAALLAAAIAVLAPRPRAVLTGHWREAGAFLGWGLAPLLVLACSANQMWRFTVPALAGAGIGLGILLHAAAQRLGRWAPWAAALVWLWPAAVYWEQTTGRALPLLSRGGPAAAWVCNGPPDQAGRWGQEELLAVIAREAGRTRETKSAWVVFGSRHFNQLTADYFAALNVWPLRFPPMAPPESAEGFLDRMTARQIEFVLSIESPPAGMLTSPFNRRVDEVRRRLYSKRWPYRLWLKRRLDNGAVVVVFRRSDRASADGITRRKTSAAAPLPSGSRRQMR